MAEFAVLTGHLDRRSRPGAISRTLAAELRDRGAEVTEIAVGALPHSTLMARDHRHPAVLRTQRVLTGVEAAAVVLPRYEPHGSAPLRSWLAMLPAEALRGKSVLPLGLGTVRSQATGLGAQLCSGIALPPVFLYDDWFAPDRDWEPNSRAFALLRQAAAALAASALPESAAA
ncbi:hypothetical protein EIL87_05010 [Saccharopolyspora rhizosphaerae]|uniref:NADPH-dependent FMN reductase-like domain-containing protein n=1 Tax=Saccharopolyspora rhizosphaerae TaxID=2492662 RepID=A0A3R8R5I3_9PSEU|nr:NAD(P)H-dependent oxidoreductase [Saccharopolyspora rhizosphaerae]RRO18875.1 hypothetical protein EIL87_05010 [Saccharopolyspora rhizosphaerae]